MSAAPTIALPDAPPSSTATYITDSRSLLVVRVLWVAVLVFQLLVIRYLLLIPATGNYENDPRYSMEAMAPLREAGLLEASWLFNKAMGLFHAVVCVTLSSILMWRSRNERTALLFALILLPLTALVMPNPIDSIPHVLAASKNYLANLAILALIYLFPDGRFTPKWSFLIYGALFIMLPINFLTNEIIEGKFIIPYIIAMGFGISTMLYRYRRADQRQRQQMKWLLNIFVFVPVIFVTWFTAFLIAGDLYPLIQILLGFIFVLLTAAMPLAVGLAVLRYGLWSVDLVVNRSLVYGAVTILLVLIFALSVFGIQSILGAENTVAAFIVSALPPIVLFNPTRKRVQNLVDRYIYRLNFNLNELAAAHKPLAIANPGALSGKNLDGYEVQDVIGRSGMGEVYRAVGNGQTVAIKTILSKSVHDPDMRTRFQREAQAGMQLDHPHIAKVYAHGEVDGTPYLVMDYIEGQDLSHILKTGGRLDEETTTRMMQDICAALEVAHSKGFIHRDLKPSNIMIKPNGQAILIDFGVTKMTDASINLTGSGAIGTIDYMAPEQIMSAKEVDKRADIYALGVMLYEMLTGEKPFKGSAAQIMFAHLQQPAPDPRDSNPDIPSHIAEAIERAMSKEPKDRFQSAGELATALLQ